MHTMIIPVVLVGMFALIVIIFLAAVAFLIIHSARSARRNNFPQSQFPGGVGAFGMVDPIVPPPVMIDDGASANSMPHPDDRHPGHHGQDSHQSHAPAPDAGSFGGSHHGGGFDSGGGSFNGGDSGGGGHSH